MRKALLIATGLCLMAPPVLAQLPDESTADDPRWYYIRVNTTDESRAGRVFTYTPGSDNVMGRPMTVSTDMDEVAGQLWRFEKDGTAYTIINKATGRELDVTYDAGIDISRAVLADKAVARFTLNSLDGGFRIQSSLAPEGGLTDEVYLHQANAGGGRDYAIMMVSSTWSSSPESNFSFIPFEDYSIEFSTEEVQTLYQLVNAKDGARCLTEDVTADYPLQLKDADPDDHAQQWMVMKKSTDGTLVDLVNRATGHIMQTRSGRYGAFNLPELSSVVMPGSGWRLDYLGDTQYTVSGLEEDGIVRYLGASTGDTPEAYDEEQVVGSAFGWKFRKVDTTTGVTDVEADDVAWRVVDGRIVTCGTSDCRIYTVDGKLLPRSARLVPGIYIVSVNGKAHKVIIND